MLYFNSKETSIDILKKYFQKFNLDEIQYYLNIKPNAKPNAKLNIKPNIKPNIRSNIRSNIEPNVRSNIEPNVRSNIRSNIESIPKFIESNVYDPEDIELKNLLSEHFLIVIEKIFYLTTLSNLVRTPIKISFVTNSIYWTELFVISDTIFIHYDYLIKIFENIEYKQYNSANDVYIKNNKIYDFELLKKISTSVYCILQYLNPDYWHRFVCDKYRCGFINVSEIKFINKFQYKFLHNPNTSFIHGKIPIYYTHSNKIYGVFDSICSDLSFGPYWKKNQIELIYKNGFYQEINNKSNEQFNSESDEQFNSESDEQIDLEPNPFISKANQITNNIIYIQNK